MKAVVFDTGPLISLAMNNLLWILKPLKDRFNGEFFITDSVKKECVDRPLSSKKFKYEAIQIFKLVQDNVIKVFHEEKLTNEAQTLLDLANSLFRAQNNYVKIVQFAEIESVILTRMLSADAVIIDEFITRTLIENPVSVQERLEKKLHMKVETDKDNLQRFREEVTGIRVIRSVELVTVAYELGLFKEFYLNMPHPRKTLLDGLLWAIKLNGCSVSEKEIGEIMRMEKF